MIVFQDEVLEVTGFVHVCCVHVLYWTFCWKG